MNKKTLKRFLNTFDHLVVGISSGKDSTATLLYLLRVLKINPTKIICTFADTGNEASETYAHIELISKKLHPVITVYPRLGFYELAKEKGRFPSLRARYCTTELKLEPTKNYIYENLNGRILMINGMRAEESKKRASYRLFATPFETYAGFYEFRPLLSWGIERVFLIHKRFNFPLNPLYKDFSRVGCFPCIFWQKGEIRRLARRNPERIDFIREQENSFSNRNNFAEYYKETKAPKRYRSKTIISAKGEPMQTATIDDVVAWANSTDHGRGTQQNFHFEDYETECKAGVCE